MNDNMDKKILIIIGSAPCVVNDVYQAARLISSAVDDSILHYMAIGLNTMDIPTWSIQYFATYHPVDIEIAKIRREAAGGNIDYKVISHIREEEDGDGRMIKYDVDMIIPLENPSGSSSLLGVLAGIQLGYEKIIVCGCPLIGNSSDTGYDYAKFQKGWTHKFREIKHKTRSMSGWTKELLGAPSESWISETK